jgi:hypothetical protein
VAKQKAEEKAEEMVEVISRLPVALLLSGDPAGVRQMLGEEVYRQALLKMNAPEGYRQGKMLDA